MPTPEELFTERITSVIADHGVTEIARRLEMDPASVRLWRRGHKPYPQNIRALCKAFGIDREWLETGAEKQNAENNGSLSQSSVREEPGHSDIAGMPDEMLGTRLAGMIKNFPKVPLEFRGASLDLLRAYTREFFSRAESRLQGAAVTYPISKPNHRKP